MYGNELIRCQNSAVKVINSPQIICENEVESPDETDDNVSRPRESRCEDLMMSLGALDALVVCVPTVPLLTRTGLI